MCSTSGLAQGVGWVFTHLLEKLSRAEFEFKSNSNLTNFNFNTQANVEWDEGITVPWGKCAPSVSN